MELMKMLTESIAKTHWLKSLIFPFYKKLGIQALHHKKRNDKMQSYGLETLKLLSNTLHKEKINYWLDFGTLLGIVRDKDIIQHDTDIDIAILAEEYSEKIDNILVNAGFSIWRSIYI